MSLSLYEAALLMANGQILPDEADANTDTFVVVDDDGDDLPAWDDLEE